MSISYQELKKKDVLEIYSGKNLGRITDVIIEKKTGKILNLIVPGKRGGFLSCENLEIKYSQIERIGDDVILVDTSKKQLPQQPRKPRPQRLCGEDDCLPCDDCDCFGDD